MKRLSEVCNLVGVTRRTLQEYDRIGLLKHTAETEGGYWLYDDEAIKVLIFIQTFIEIGYKRKNIKEILNYSLKDLDKEFDVAIETLNEQKKKIDGMIKYVHLLKTILMSSEKTLSSLLKMDVVNLYKEKSFTDTQNELINLLVEENDEEDDPNAFYCGIRIMNTLYSIGCNKDLDCSDKTTQDCVDELFQLFKQIMDDEEMIDCDSVVLMSARTLSLFQDEEIKESIVDLAGEGSIEYITRSVCYYANVFCKRHGRLVEEILDELVERGLVELF